MVIASMENKEKIFRGLKNSFCYRVIYDNGESVIAGFDCKCLSAELHTSPENFFGGERAKRSFLKKIFRRRRYVNYIQMRNPLLPQDDDGVVALRKWIVVGGVHTTQFAVWDVQCSTMHAGGIYVLPFALIGR